MTWIIASTAAAPRRMFWCAAAYSVSGRPRRSSSTQRIEAHASAPTTTSETAPSMAAMRACTLRWERARL